MKNINVFVLVFFEHKDFHACKMKRRMKIIMFFVIKLNNLF